MLQTDSDGVEGSARPCWWTQVALIGAVLVAYDAVNNLNPISPDTATAHATGLIHLEMRLHLDPEVGLNRWLGGHLALGRLVGDYYDLAHLGVTLAVLIWIWWRHPPKYRLLRNALLVINAVGFAVFWLFPVAPPRMLNTFGFTDVVAVAHSLGSWSTGTLASQANEYAAMPSLHVAWALWCTFAVWIVCKDAIRRVLAGVYALGTGVAVLATANHYFLDVVGGAATAGVAAVAALRLAHSTARVGDGSRSRRRTQTLPDAGLRKPCTAPSETLVSPMTGYLAAIGRVHVRVCRSEHTVKSERTEQGTDSWW